LGRGCSKGEDQGQRKKIWKCGGFKVSLELWGKRGGMRGMYKKVGEMV